MRNSTPMFARFLLLAKSWHQTMLLAVLLLPSVIATAQRIPAGVTIPVTPTNAPQQFTTNLQALGSGTTVDGNIAVLDNSFSNAVDNTDGVKTLDPNRENFGLVRNGTDLVLESRQQVVETDTLFYRMTNMKVQDYRLEFFPINMVVPGLSAILVDRYLGTRTAISLSSAPSYYQFSVTADAASAAENRFILVFLQADPTDPLPVTFINITAAQVAGGIQVSWRVAAERAIVNYSIEKSDNGRNFSPVGSINASGYSEAEKTYSFKDIALQSGTRFYRIRSNGADGEQKYSAVVKMAIGGKAAIAVMPNPVKGGVINLQFTKMPKGRYQLSLQGIEGRALYNQVVQHTGDNASYTLALPAVARGSYVLSIIQPDASRSTQLLLIE
jgi:hypothetical protein